MDSFTSMGQGFVPFGRDNGGITEENETLREPLERKCKPKLKKDDTKTAADGMDSFTSMGQGFVPFGRDNGGITEENETLREPLERKCKPKLKKDDTKTAAAGMDSFTSMGQGFVPFCRDNGGITEENETLREPLERKCKPKLKKDDTKTAADETSQWKVCIETKAVAKIQNLLKKGSLPDPHVLQDAYIKFKKEDPALLKEICEAVEEHITGIDDNIVSTHACYKAHDKERIVFVVHTSNKKENNLNIRYPFYSIGLDNYDGDAVIDTERQGNLSFEGDEYEDIADCLRTNSPDLMEKHSNLTNTSISHFKASKKHGLKKAYCIVFYVFAKGYIPIGEEPLPSCLKSKTKIYQTDVREGRTAVFSLGPDEEHTDLKTGCRIESSQVPDGGTIGAFVIHPKNGLCLITCSHVLLNISQFQKLYQGRKKEENENSLPEIQCFQPQQPYQCGKIVDVRLFGANDMKRGMDIAFVKVDDSRKPKTNSFPDILGKDLIGKRTPYIDALLSKTFKYNPTAVIQQSSELQNSPIHVVKYGKTSKLTLGKIAKSGCSARVEFYGHSFSDARIPRPTPKRVKFYLADQIEIQDDGMRFSSSGDSGAMVFIADGNNELVALGILTARKDQEGITYVTPIWNILEEIDMPLPYSLAENSPAGEILERLKRDINLLGNIVDQLEETRQ